MPADARRLGEPNYDAYRDAPASPVRPTLHAVSAVAPAAFVASRDTQRGTPTFVWAARNAAPAPLLARTPVARARWFVARHAPLLGVPAHALATAEVVGVHDLGRGGTIVAFQQRVEGVPVFREELKVLLDPAGRLVAISGSLHPAASAGTLARSSRFPLAAAQALAFALADHTGVTLAPADLVESSTRRDGVRRFTLATGRTGDAAKLHLTDAATARPVLFPLPATLVPAYHVEVMVGDASGTGHEAVQYVIAADDGRVLLRRGLTFNESFDYRVWADTTGEKRPWDGPTEDYTPHHTGLPDGSGPAFAPPVMVTMEGFNTPAGGAVDPWLPAGATVSTGNNVDAYADHAAPDGFGEGDRRATVTAAGVFDRVYDTLREPLADDNQIQAAIIQIFYVTNWLHDYWYDSGFDEAAGNAQTDNYGRGGQAGDVIKVEAQDNALGGSRNNANMSTPSDGTSPRMQMYLWNGREERVLSVQPMGSNLPTGTASFGPLNFDLTAEVTIADDGTDPISNGCEALVGNVTGKIVLVDRGACNFAVKAKNIELAGGVAAIVINNAAGSPPGMANGNPPQTVAIPTLSVTQADGQMLRDALTSGAISLRIKRQSEVERDGTIDNGIVAHEWGHYIHNRLVSCGSSQCGAMGEGWGDFLALHLSVREGDDLRGVYPAAAYSTAMMGDNNYYGIRRVPYSVDFDRNALTFKHISDGIELPTTHPVKPSGPNSEVHNAGEVWATMMFECFIALLEQSEGATPRYTFDEARRRMADYVVAGMKLAPSAPTFLEQRDAILAAAAAADAQDFSVLAHAFARRGAGTGAIGPDRASNDFTGITESFEVLGDLRLVDAHLDDAISSCDDDGLLDAGESGTLFVQVINPGAETLEGTTVKASSATAGVTFPAGDTATIPTLAPYQIAEVQLTVALDTTFVGPARIELGYTAANVAAATDSVSAAISPRADYDNQLEASATDDVESDVIVWGIDVIGTATESWTRALDGGDFAWHGQAPGASTDASLVSPALVVGPTDPFVVTFSHHYSFEADGENYYDGAVIEISEDDGATWADVATTGVVPGYGGTITGTSSNPLGTAMAFVAKNLSWPADDPVSLDFGTAYAGKTVKLRFRIGTDPSVGDDGWFIDDVVVTGITNTPFARVIDDAGECGRAPIADAGNDRSIFGGSFASLDGRGSTDPDGDPLTFAWTQTAGPEIALSATDIDQPTFTAPQVTEVVTLEFQLSVSDGTTADVDTVTILVHPPSSPGDGQPEDGDGGGCGCAVAGRSAGGGPFGAGLALLAGLGAGLVLVRRRRRGA